MRKAVIVDDEQLNHAVQVAKAKSRENGTRNAALLLTCFNTGLTVTEIAQLKVSDYLAENGQPLRESLVRAEIALNHKRRPLYWTKKNLTDAIDAHLAERLERGHGVTGNSSAYRGLDPESALFVSGRTGTGLKISAQRQGSKVYHSSTQLSRIYSKLFQQAGITGASGRSGRRTLAVKMKRRCADRQDISETLGIESPEAITKICAENPPRFCNLVRRNT